MFTSSKLVPRDERHYNAKDIKIKYHHNDLERIEKIPQGNWIDLRAAETVELKQGEFKIISLGISMELPMGYEALIAPRSSTFKKWKILQVNSPGVVDDSFKGNNDIWGMAVLAMEDTKINFNDRICQFRLQQTMEHSGIIPVFIETDNLENADRGGFGSTGTK